MLYHRRSYRKEVELRVGVVCCGCDSFATRIASSFDNSYDRDMRHEYNMMVGFWNCGTGNGIAFLSNNEPSLFIYCVFQEMDEKPSVRDCSDKQIFKLLTIWKCLCQE